MNSMRDYKHRLWEISKWRRRIGAYVPPTWSRKPLVQAHVVCTRFSSREQDFDNLVASFKSIIDALIFHDIIIDDGPKVLTREYRWIKAKKGDFRIVLNITGA